MVDFDVVLSLLKKQQQHLCGYLNTLANISIVTSASSVILVIGWPTLISHSCHFGMKG